MYINNDFDRYFFVGALGPEILLAIKNAPVDQDKKSYVFEFLEEQFQNTNWSLSFEKKLVLYYDEIMTSELLILIHCWLRTKCADIENIILITASSSGISDWWKNWCELHHERSFDIFELTWLNPYFSCDPEHYLRDFEIPVKILPNEYFRSKKDIKHYFSFYGGVNFKNDKMYIFLKLLALHKFGVVEYLGETPPKQDIIDYVESITYFKNQKEVDNISQLYDDFFTSSKLHTKNIVEEHGFFKGHLFETDLNCFANVIRESVNDEPWTIVTEKTMRPFFHHQVVIPGSYLAVDTLQQQGFWFPHDIIDYSYQYQRDYSRRITGMINALEQLISKYSLNDLQQYYAENFDRFYHNSKQAQTTSLI